MNEVKRQAMDEVQKAVAEAEQKAFEMIASERAKMEKTLADAKRKAKEDAIMVINEQEDSSEVSRDTDSLHSAFILHLISILLSPDSAALLSSTELYSIFQLTFLVFWHAALFWFTLIVLISVVIQTAVLFGKSSKTLTFAICLAPNSRQTKT